MKKYILVLVGAITLASCSTYKHSYRLTDVPNNSIEVTATVVDIKTDFDRKVNGTSDRATSSVQDAKANAYFNAIQDNDIDVLVDPIYSVRVSRGLFRSSAKASVSGFAGEFVNPRSVSQVQQEVYDAKIKALEQFLDIKLIVNEDKPTTIISNCSTNGKSSSHTINGAPALIDQFNSIYGGANINSSSNDSGDDNTSDEGGNGGLFGKLLK